MIFFVNGLTIFNKERAHNFSSNDGDNDMTVEMVSFETQNLKLASLLLSEIPSSTFKVDNKVISGFKNIIILHPKDQVKTRDKLVSMFAIKKARGDIFKYNRSINDLRDALKGNGA